MPRPCLAEDYPGSAGRDHRPHGTLEELVSVTSERPVDSLDLASGWKYISSVLVTNAESFRPSRPSNNVVASDVRGMEL